MTHNRDTEPSHLPTSPAKRHHEESTAFLLLAVGMLLFVAIAFIYRKKDPELGLEWIEILIIYGGGPACSAWCAWLLRRGRGSVLAWIILGVLSPWWLGTLALIVFILCKVRGAESVPVPVTIAEMVQAAAYAIALTARIRASLGSHGGTRRTPPDCRPHA